jgi:hypothetical protein
VSPRLGLRQANSKNMKKQNIKTKKKISDKTLKKYKKSFEYPLNLKTCLHAKHFCLKPLTKINKESKAKKNIKNLDVIGRQQNSTKEEEPKK